MRYLKLYKESRDNHFVSKYRNYSPFLLEDHEDICNFFGKELENASKVYMPWIDKKKSRPNPDGEGLTYLKNFIVKLYNLNSQLEYIDDSSGFPDFDTNKYFFTMLCPIDPEANVFSYGLYIVRQWSFDLNGKICTNKNSNYRNLNEIKLSRMDRNIDFELIGKFLRQKNYTTFIEDANDAEVEKGNFR